MKMTKELIIAVIIIALLLFGGGFIVAKKIKAKKKRRKSGQDWLSNFKKAKKEVDKTFEKSFEDSRYNLAANTLERSMDGAGTSDALLFSTIQTVVKNPADYMALVAAFGLRQDSSLADWFEGDLSDGQLDTLKKYLVGVGVKPENMGF